jgi:hypothetical protein
MLCKCNLQHLEQLLSSALLLAAMLFRSANQAVRWLLLWHHSWEEGQRARLALQEKARLLLPR